MPLHKASIEATLATDRVCDRRASREQAMNNTDDFTFQGQGTLKRIDTFVSKAGKSILTLVFEIQGQYPQLIPIKVFGRLAEQAASWKPGSVLSVTGRLGGRDWNGKVYGDSVATSIEIVSAAGEKDDNTPPGHDAAPPLGDDDVPF
jgi:hypothetical protein